MMGTEVPETCWAYHKCNKAFSDIYLVFLLYAYATIHGQTHTKFVLKRPQFTWVTQDNQIHVRKERRENCGINWISRWKQGDMIHMPHITTLHLPTQMSEEHSASSRNVKTYLKSIMNYKLISYELKKFPMKQRVDIWLNYAWLQCTGDNKDKSGITGIQNIVVIKIRLRSPYTLKSLLFPSAAQERLPFEVQY